MDARIRAAMARLKRWDAGERPSQIYRGKEDVLLAADNDAWDVARWAIAVNDKLAALLIACDSELSAIAHGRPPSDKETLLLLSARCRQAATDMKGGAT